MMAKDDVLLSALKYEFTRLPFAFHYWYCKHTQATGKDNENNNHNNNNNSSLNFPPMRG